MMCHACILLYVLFFLAGSPTSTAVQMVGIGVEFDPKPLIVGRELWKETIPLQMGSRLYQLQGLKSQTWYEVKISYPASIPARFFIQLKKDNSDQLGMNHNRRLLNTDKLIFKTDNLCGYQDKRYVLVTVEAEGVVAVLHVPERQHIIFNIVCDELLLGITHEAWWVGVLVLLCLGLASTIPRFLPSYLLPNTNGHPETLRHNFSKEY